jgi:hypothetical protein
MDPMTQAILMQIGMKLSEKVLGMFEQPSPAERALTEPGGRWNDAGFTGK